jgi:hypothetical protein
MFRQFRPFARQALEHSGLFRPAEVRHALARLRKVNTALNRWPIFIGHNVPLANRSPSAKSMVEILLYSAPVLLGIKPVTEFSLPPNQISSFRFCAWISQIRAAGLLDLVAKLEPSEGEMKENGSRWRKIHINDEITVGSTSKIIQAAEQVSDRYLRRRIANKGVYRAIQKNSPDKIFEAVQKLRRGADGIFYGYPEPAVKGFTKFYRKRGDAQQFNSYSSKWSNIAIFDTAQTPELITRTLNRFDAATELMGLYLFMVHALRFYLTYSMPSVAGLNFKCNLYLSQFNHPFTDAEVEMFLPR